jgi:hypothetical protein
MSDESGREPVPIRPERPKGSPAIWVIALLVFLPIGYVLSIGPVVAIAERNKVGEETVKIFYTPVIWLHDHTVLEKPLEWYAQLWGWH